MSPTVEKVRPATNELRKNLLFLGATTTNQPISSGISQGFVHADRACWLLVLAARCTSAVAAYAHKSPLFSILMEQGYAKIRIFAFR